jgi:nucleoside-diphosphate-sugar epimerase
MTLHVIVGAGPVGWVTASLLADGGHDVRVVTRDGGGPEHPLVERVRADAADPRAMRDAAAGASVLYNAAGPPYHRWVSDWPPLAASVLAAAEAAGAVLVSVGNLYGYGPSDNPAAPLTERDPQRATTPKGAVRARVWQDALAAHEAGRVRVTELRSSDYFGPHVVNSQLGERTIPKVVAGKPVRVFGDPDMAHSWTYINDVARALVVLGDDERAWGRAWHTPTNPPLTQRQVVDALSAAASVHPVKVRSLSPVLLKALGVFVPDIRELAEVRYQFDAPFVVDSSAARATFGVAPTSMHDALAETVSWYRDRSTTKEHAHGR